MDTQVVLESAEHFLIFCLEMAILLFEYVGMVVIVAAGAKGIYNYVRKNKQTRLQLAKGLAMGLEFKLGSEILRTVMVRDFSEILIVGAIIALRAVLTFLIHWEIKNELKEQFLHEAEQLREEAEQPSSVGEAMDLEEERDAG